MPIPKPPKEGWESKEQLFEAYAKDGWSRSIEYDWIHVDTRRDVLYKVRYRCDANKLSIHGSCNSGEYLLVELRPHGVILTCANCRHTFGMVSKKSQQELSRERVSLLEAKTVLDSTGQQPPIGLDERIKAVSHMINIRVNEG